MSRLLDFSPAHTGMFYAVVPGHSATERDIIDAVEAENKVTVKSITGPDRVWMDAMGEIRERPAAWLVPVSRAMVELHGIGSGGW